MRSLHFVLLALLTALAACEAQEQRPARPDPAPAEPSAARPVGEAPSPMLERLAERVWLHKSYKHVEPYGLVLSQGLVIASEGGAVLVDTAWTDEDTEIILDLVRLEIGETPVAAILTHAHEDKMGGVGALMARGIPSFAHPLANVDAALRGLLPAQGAIPSHGNEERLLDGDIVVFFPGAAHTRDNLVVYFAPSRVLFGGCMIRPGDSRNLGNTADADIDNWASAARAVAERFPQADIVVPSHGAPGGRELIDVTVGLAERARGQ
jgi:metallo-beta-lactamase class B